MIWKGHSSTSSTFPIINQNRHRSIWFSMIAKTLADHQYQLTLAEHLARGCGELLAGYQSCKLSHIFTLRSLSIFGIYQLVGIFLQIKHKYLQEPDTRKRNLKIMCACAEYHDIRERKASVRRNMNELLIYVQYCLHWNKWLIDWSYPYICQCADPAENSEIQESSILGSNFFMRR